MDLTNVRVVGGRPSDATLADVKALNKLNPTQFAEMLDMTFAFLLNGDSAALAGALESFSAKHGANLTALKSCSQTLLAIPAEAVRRGLTESQLRQDLDALGLEASRAAALADRWTASYAALSRVCARRTPRPNQLLDVEWKFGVTVASSEHELKSSFVQLKLSLEDRQAGAPREVHVEMNLPQFYSLCHEMEQAKRTLQSIQ